MPAPTKAEVLPLHSHSLLSILDGASSIQEYLEYCQQRGLCGCGITDHGYVLGLHELMTKAPKYGVRPIPAIEFYLAPRADHVFNGPAYDYFHLTVWARSLEGYQTLIALSSRSWHTGRPVTRFGRKLPRITFDDLKEMNAGLIVGSGCIEGPIGKPLLRGETHEAIKNLNIIREIFKDRLFMELMPHAVDRNWIKEEIVQVETEDGVVLNFKADDQVLTEDGWMTAQQAMERGVGEILSSNPLRAQDAQFDPEHQQRQLAELAATVATPVDPHAAEPDTTEGEF